ncbi:hypothetical protein Micbo1qcDRAFT_166385, partial [Microdochium bolleyi]
MKPLERSLLGLLAPRFCHCRFFCGCVLSCAMADSASECGKAVHHSPFLSCSFHDGASAQDWPKATDSHVFAS